MNKNNYTRCPQCNEVYTGNTCPNWRKHPRNRPKGTGQKWSEETIVRSLRLPVSVWEYMRDNGGLQAWADKTLIAAAFLAMMKEQETKGGKMKDIRVFGYGTRTENRLHEMTDNLAGLAEAKARIDSNGNGVDEVNAQWDKERCAQWDGCWKCTRYIKVFDSGEN